MSSLQAKQTRDRKVANVLTLGCKVNQFESAALTGQLIRAGYRLASRGEVADLTVINTCTVTHRADFEARALIRRAWRANPSGRIVVTGCLAQVRPEEIAGLPGVNLIVGQEHKSEFLDLLERGQEGPQILVSPVSKLLEMPDLGFPGFERTRAFFRIQDGCSSACTYCTVPLARGPSRSLPAEQVASGLKHYLDTGYREVVLTGVHLGAWGLDLKPPTDLTILLTQLAAELRGPRLRLSSIEPHEVTPGLISLLSSSARLAPHLHLPVQSGADQVLTAMNRPYSAAWLKDLLADLSKGPSGLCLGADVLVGFPGEDRTAFEETYNILLEGPWSYFHVFPFSPRPGTPAAGLPGRASPPEVKARVEALRCLGQDKRLAFYQSCLGQVRPTLIENTKDRVTGLSRGLTDNYLPVLVNDPAPAAGWIVQVRLIETTPSGRVLGQTA